MWHSLTIGNPDENVELVLGTVVGWFNERIFNNLKYKYYFEKLIYPYRCFRKSI